MKNQREIYEALLAGETLEGHSDLIKFKEGELVSLINNNRHPAWVFNHPGKWQIHKEPKWYENIPDGGVLCWCKDGESDKESIGQINEKGKANGYYTASYKHWIYATPLTKQEIQAYLNNAPEDL